MKSPYDVILSPVISEKSYDAIDENKYTFMVDPRVNKTEIRKAVELVFDVKVLRVNTIRTKGKPRRQGWTSGRTTSGKKAVVTLAPGDEIKFFEK